jgi:hypothetical protein
MQNFIERAQFEIFMVAQSVVLNPQFWVMQYMPVVLNSLAV